MPTAAPHPAPPERVLSTLLADGRRRWLEPRLSRGRFLRRRRALAYLLMAIFCALPFMRVGGLPAVLLDIPGRRFVLFGSVFLATDTLMLMLLVLSIVLGIFILTALFGRVWCGWACPQTVYLEFLFRPLGRFIEGGTRNVERGGARPSGARRAAKHIVTIALCGFLAHVFLGYFVGMDDLSSWLTRSPTEHWGSFLLVLGVTAAMVFDFAFFREQTCLVACPYGRFQSVLLDRSSWIVGYDRTRGEPRGKGRRAEGSSLGDCVDCNRCVVTCPTGIDIRDGLQMECIHCTQCIDACDEVMVRIGRPRGLIRYSSQDELAGRGRRFLRPRTIIYPLLLAVVLGLLVTALATRAPADLVVLRERGAPFEVLADGRVLNRLIVKLVNRDTVPHEYRISVAGEVELRGGTTAGPLAAGATAELSVEVLFPGTVHEVEIVATDDAGRPVRSVHRLIGPPVSGGGRP